CPSGNPLPAVRNQHIVIGFPSGACSLRGLDTKPDQQSNIRFRGPARMLRLAALINKRCCVAGDKLAHCSYDGKLWPNPPKRQRSPRSPASRSLLKTALLPITTIFLKNMRLAWSFMALKSKPFAKGKP